MDGMRFEEIEAVYEAIAEQIDRAGREGESLFLARLCLLLAHRLADPALVRECISRAAAAAGSQAPVSDCVGVQDSTAR